MGTYSYTSAQIAMSNAFGNDVVALFNRPIWSPRPFGIGIYTN